MTEQHEQSTWIAALDRLANMAFGPAMVQAWLAPASALNAMRRHKGFK
jgi:hypothetical protein